jgi:hypothetical protein
VQIRTYVVWIPILDADEVSEVPSASTNIAITPQYFDGQKRLGDQLAKSFDVEQPVWDSFFFYPPGVTWTDAGLPLPEVAIAQEGGVVVGTPGSLPPLPDQSRLVPALKGKAVVIGEQENFEAILEQIARAFVARHRR